MGPPFNEQEVVAVAKLEELHAKVERRGRLTKHAIPELGAALREFHLLNGYTAPYRKTDIPEKTDKSACLGDYAFE
ncbi:MAG: hypothetical protein ACREBR_00180 [bacterium]